MPTLRNCYSRFKVVPARGNNTLHTRDFWPILMMKFTLASSKAVFRLQSGSER